MAHENELDSHGFKISTKKRGTAKKKRIVFFKIFMKISVVSAGNHAKEGLTVKVFQVLYVVQLIIS